MALRYAVATGNWSAVGTWDGGAAKPAAGDAVHANGYTVTVDEDTPDTLLSLNTIAGGAAAAGGNFAVTGTRTIYATTINTGSEHCITFSGAGGSTLTIDAAGGTINGSSTTNSKYGINATGAGDISITGAITGGNGTSRIGLYRSSTGGTVTITGDITGGSGGDAYGVRFAGTATVVIVGDITGSTGTGLYTSGGAGTLDITGDLAGAAQSAVDSNTAWATTIVGNVTGGTSTNAGLRINGGVSLTHSVTGTVTGGTGTNTIRAHGIYQVDGTGSASVFTIVGDIYAARGGCGFVSENTACNNKIDGDIYNVATYAPYGSSHSVAGLCVPQFTLEGTTQWRCYEYDKTTSHILYSAAVSPGMPDETDVRSGTVYGQSSELLGTCAVPAAASVTLGTPIDASVGTLEVTGVKLYRIG